NGTSEIYILELRTGKLQRVTSGHVDFASSIDSSRKVLYFSRKGQISKKIDGSAFFSGFHIWRMPVVSKLIHDEASIQNHGAATIPVWSVNPCQLM
ncbi:MAG: hypothetical protein ACRD4I_09710, partial [Candidatus Angelobacter sp.]